MDDTEALLVLLGAFVLVSLCVLLSHLFVTGPQQRDREASRLAWQKRQREYEARQHEYDPELRYGAYHQAMKRKHQKEIDAGRGRCMERICVMPTRRIEPGEFWHLAHDHVKGGATDYLGPAHPECNEAEAQSRGVRFESSFRPPSGTYYSATRNDDPWADVPQPFEARDQSDEWWKREPPDQADPWSVNTPSAESNTSTKPITTQSNAQPSVASLGGAADVEEMKTLIDLHNRGVISRKEFDAARARLLALSEPHAARSWSHVQRQAAQWQSDRELHEFLRRAEQRSHRAEPPRRDISADRRRVEVEAEEKRQERERRFNDMLKSPPCPACGRIPEPFSGQCACR